MVGHVSAVRGGVGEKEDGHVVKSEVDEFPPVWAERERERERER